MKTDLVKQPLYDQTSFTQNNSLRFGIGQQLCHHILKSVTVQYVWDTSSLQSALVTTDTHFFVPRREPPWPDHPWTSVQLIGLTCQQTDRLVLVIQTNQHTNSYKQTPKLSDASRYTSNVIH